MDLKTPVNVSIVTYRSDISQVRGAADSLLAAGLPVSLAVVDNDSGAEYVARLAAALPETARLIRAPRNGGFGYGHNLALAAAGPSDYTLVLNPDVVMHPGALEALAAFLDAHPAAVMAAPKVLYADGRLQPLNKRDPNVLDLVLRRVPERWSARVPFARERLRRYEMRDVGYDLSCEVPFVSGCCFLIRTKVFRALGGFDERFFLYFEDADLTRRARAIGETWYVPDAAIVHGWNRASKGSLRMLWVLVRSMVAYFGKWGWRWA